MIAPTSLPPDVRALRTAAAIARTGRTRVVALRGEDARAAALWLLPSRLQLRDAQARQSLLLDATGLPIADVTVAADDEDYLLLVDGLEHDALLAHLSANLDGVVRSAIDDLSETHDVVSVHGPWAWELVADVLGPDLVALPYLNFFRIDQGFCVRAGRTGEYGYEIVVERSEADRVFAALCEKGAAFDAEQIGPGTLALGGFESWFFDAAFVPGGATPIELSLQWRLAPDRDYLGRAAIDARRVRGIEWRLGCLIAEDSVASGDPVRLNERVIGEVVRAERSHSLGCVVASAKLPPALTHGGLTGLRVGRDGAYVAARTVTPPLLDNRSLYVDPRRHTYRAADEVRFGSVDRPVLGPA